MTSSRGFGYGHDSERRGTDEATTGSHLPPLSPRLHSLPDNVLSPLGLLAEASLQNTDPSKKHATFSRNGNAPVRPSPLSLGVSAKLGQNGPNQRLATSDVRGQGPEVGVASLNYFKPGNMSVHPGGDERLPELLNLITREEIDELFDIFFDHSE